MTASAYSHVNATGTEIVTSDVTACVASDPRDCVPFCKPKTRAGSGEEIGDGMGFSVSEKPFLFFWAGAFGCFKIIKGDQPANSLSDFECSLSSPSVSIHHKVGLHAPIIDRAHPSITLFC